MTNQGSVSRFILGVKDGDSLAQNELWQRYFDKLVRVARQKLAGMGQPANNEEDVALGAFQSFYKAAEQGRFPDMNSRDDLWRLLLRMAARKAVDEARHNNRLKRGGGNVRGESVFATGGDQDEREGLAAVVGDEPTPEFAVTVGEECERLLALLDPHSPVLRAIALDKLEGYENQEIASRRECSLTTIERRLRLIRAIWKDASPTDD